MNDPKGDLSKKVSTDVGFYLAGACIGAGVSWGFGKFTPFKPPWWLGVVVGIAVASAASWKQENAG